MSTMAAVRRRFAVVLGGGLLLLARAGTSGADGFTVESSDGDSRVRITAYAQADGENALLVRAQVLF